MYTNIGRGHGWVAGGPPDGACSLAGGKLTPDEIELALGLLVERVGNRMLPAICKR